jgi:hypothetical protein
VNNLLYALVSLFLIFTQPILGGDNHATAQEPPTPPPIAVEPQYLQEIPKLEPVAQIQTPLPEPVAPVYIEAAAQADTTNLYDPGQCTWYVKSMKPEIPNTWGDAIDWYANAQAQGWPTGSEPRVGAAGWRYGHIVYIKAVDPINQTVTYTDMNGRYIPYEIGERTVAQSTLMYIY